MKPLCTLMFFLRIAIKPDIKNINVKLFKTPFILGKMSSFDPNAPSAGSTPYGISDQLIRTIVISFFRAYLKCLVPRFAD